MKDKTIHQATVFGSLESLEPAPTHRVRVESNGDDDTGTWEHAKEVYKIRRCHGGAESFSDWPDLSGRHIPDGII